MLRTVLVASTLVAGLVTTGPAAHAEPGVLVLAGTLTIDPGNGWCPSYDRCTGSATFTAAGTHSGTVHATFVYDVPPALCPVSVQIAGRFTGAIDAYFTWVQMGPLVFGQVTGQVNGALHAYAVPPAPADCETTGARDYPAVVTIAGS
ncbi:MAG TPA: hypothetical protein VNA20_12460 [Frankiaceae bacterium]|nr:hypothetical protein [Frankiaceae bacterium]